MRPLPSIAALCACLAVAFGQSSSLDHYRSGVVFFNQRNYQSAANEFREALNGDLQPKWIEVWSHVNLGKVFEGTRQYERAAAQYRLAGLTNDNTGGGLDEAAKRLLEVEHGVGPPRIDPPNIAAIEPIPRTDPEYSEEARLAGLEGTVYLSGVIAEDGSPRDLKVIRPLGLGLDEKAVEAATQWRFAPRSATHDAPGVVNIAVDFLLPAKQSRWHLMGQAFHPAERVSRPVFLTTTYPLGAGIGPKALDEGWVLNAIRRQAAVTLSFDVDQHGLPVKFQIVRASNPIWEDEAIAVVRGWRFAPAVKDGLPVSAPCTVDLIWGQKTLTSWALAQIRVAMNSTPPSENPDAPAARGAVATGGDQSSKLVVLYTAEALYTDEARRAKREGAVSLSLVVGEDGVPRDIRVLRPLGMGLDEKAIESVSQWRFQPSRLNGRPAAVTTTVEVNFRLTDSTATPHP
jgi:TonB family protein